ncbi:MAG: FkbM family methyltransferase [Nanoarchaeota archaeon]
MLELIKRLVLRFVPKQSLRKLTRFVGRIYLIYYSRKFNPLIVRQGESDIDAFVQIFVQKDYKLPIKISPELIIDGGANVGYASLWFASKYPGAAIIAVEPEASNFETLEKNTAGFSNISRIKAGIWHKNAHLKIIDSGKGKWAFTTEEAGPSEKFDIDTITIGDILQKSRHERIGILKLDIEGAEKEVFSKDYEPWLEKVDVLIIELHDIMKEGCSERFYSAVNKYRWKEFRNGENIILVNNRLFGKGHADR